MDPSGLTPSGTFIGDSVTIEPVGTDGAVRSSPNGSVSPALASARERDETAAVTSDSAHDQYESGRSVSFRWYSGPSACSGSRVVVFHGAGLPARRIRGAPVAIR
jgi:hypothetical protein